MAKRNTTKVEKVLNGRRVRFLLSRPSRDEEVFKVLHLVHQYSASEIARNSCVSAQTVRNARKGPKFGGTRYPRHITLRAIAAVGGYEFRLLPQGSNRG